MDARERLALPAERDLVLPPHPFPYSTIVFQLYFFLSLLLSNFFLTCNLYCILHAELVQLFFYGDKKLN